MTITSTRTFVQLPGNGSATVFAAPMKCFSAADVVVGFIVSGAYTLQSSGYLLSNVDTNGGFTVTFTVAPPLNTTVDIRTLTALTQATEFANLGQFLPENHTEAFDRTIRAVQDVKRLAFYFGVHGPDTETTPWTALPAAALRANTNLGFDSNGLPITNVALVSGTLSASSIGSFTYPASAAETTAGITPTNLSRANSPFYDMSRYGLLPNGIDNTAIVQAVYNMAKVTGGTLYFPYGDWAFYLDLSGMANKQVYIEGNGSIFRPSTSSPTQSCVVFANNSGQSYNVPGTWYSTNVTFYNVNFYAVLYTPVIATGDVQYAVYFNGAAAYFYGCSFDYGYIAAFYCLYGQYNEFHSCQFNAASATAQSAGCILDSYGLVYATNEVKFDRCKFFLNSIALLLKGAQMTRIDDCTIQGNSIYGIWITLDNNNSYSAGTVIRNCWFEVNNGPHIQGDYQTATTMDTCIFWPSSGINVINFTLCKGVNFTNCTWQGGGTPVISLTHPYNYNDTVAITWRGNTNNGSLAVPTTVSVGHSGPYAMDVHWQGSFTGTLTGVNAVVTGTFYYTVEGDCVDLKMPTIMGTSNTTSATITGSPQLIWPAALRYGCAFLENAGVGFSGNTDITTLGVIDLYCNGLPTGFTNTGTKGILTSVFRYQLFN